MGESSKDKSDLSPSWQQQQSSSDGSSAQGSDKSVDSSPPSRATLLEQASSFLDNKEIRDASTGKKIAFLESKGLNNDEIQRLLGVSRIAEASKATDFADQGPYKNDSWITSQTDLQQHTHDMPPIITYPEFLTQSTAAPPLITVKRVLNTLYMTTAAAATIYGTSKYLIEPMMESLTEARHDLAEHAKGKLETLNSNLELIVSEVPSSGKVRSRPDDMTKDSESVDSTDSDPTELFHVDIGTQTSPIQSRRSSTSSSITSTPAKDAKLLIQQSRLKDLNTHLSDLLEDSNGVESADDVAANVSDLRTYLDGIIYSSPHSNGNLYSNIIGSSGVGGIGGLRGAGPEDDAIGNIKGEIRGIKGILLSARNFPGSNSRAVPRGNPY